VQQLRAIGGAPLATACPIMSVATPSSVPEPAALPRRVRRFAALLGIVTWAVLALNLTRPGPLGWNGPVKGEDYAHFFTIGRLVADGRADLLYDTAGQSAYLRKAIPGAPETVFIPVYGPQVALAFSPLARLPYLVSFLLWTAITVAGFAAACYATYRICPHLAARRRDVLILAAASPALWQLVLHGQNSVVAMVSLTAGGILLRERRDLLGGAALGILFYKPQLALTIGAVLLLTGRWRAIAAMAGVTLVQLGIAWAVFGEQTLVAYAGMIRRLPSLTYLLEPKLYLMHSFRAFFALLPGVKPYAVALSVALSVVAIARIVRCWRPGLDDRTSLAAVLIGTVLISPHTSVYDLVIVVPALMLIADAWIETGVAGTTWSPRWVVLSAAYVLPVWPTASRLLFVQPMVICLAWLLIESTRAGRSGQGVFGRAAQRAA
jgi:alpha-1,2-mannosyltransferase